MGLRDRKSLTEGKLDKGAYDLGSLQGNLCNLSS